jgi:glutaredoxin-dependent peroxiredoxin
MTPQPEPSVPLEIGAKAPDLTLPAHTMERVSLGKLYPRNATVLVFFPLAFSSTCTEELCSFRDDLSTYGELNAQVVAMSVDSPYVLKRFREELGAEYLFLSDFNREAAPAFGVLREAPVGPGLLRATERAAFVVDTGGIVRWAWCSPNPSLLPPYDEIKAVLAELRSDAAV